MDPRFLVDEAKLDRLAAVIAEHWPEHIAPDDLLRLELWAKLEGARAALLQTLELTELI